MKNRWGKPGSGRGFSLLEIVITTAFLAVGLISLVGLFSGSARGSTDVYLETIALSLAYETLEWVSAFTYEDLGRKEVREAIDQFVGLDQFRGVTDISLGDKGLITYPADYYRFERQVRLETQGKTTVITVQVRPAGGGLSFFRREIITLQRLVAAEYE